MKLQLKYDINVTFKSVLEEQLNKLAIPYKINGFGEVEFLQPVNMKKMEELTILLSTYGISIINDHKTQLVQKIKDTINGMINSNETITQNFSDYLAERLGYSYAYLSNLFSENTYSSIENFTIITKIDKAKELLTTESLTLTEVAFQLGYSSVAHLSRQFKKTTGITPTLFQKIIAQRKALTN
ncbi:helix-turn-helix domain-containing protein [Aquimarina agarivorans]|uniref:helix-turn-helix domain-containing protein n=1 Tax=Aquimarina agarivorans TaxID=980584 RepID=UPI000248EC5E|nr:AraC family transcriptional regulator [Aquimarina agarivorans]